MESFLVRAASSLPSKDNIKPFERLKRKTKRVLIFAFVYCRIEWFKKCKITETFLKRAKSIVEKNQAQICLKTQLSPFTINLSWNATPPALEGGKYFRKVFAGA